MNDANRWPIALLLIAFVILGLAYSIVNPLHEATDELRHYRFVRTIAENGRLPVQGQEPCRSQSHHPPLFYAVGALATGWIETGRDLCYTPPQNPFWAYRYFDVGVDNKTQYLHGPHEAFPWSGNALAAHIVRAINVLIGATTIWLTWAIGRAIWPQRPSLALGGAALVAFNPMFLYMSGAINNDVIAAMSGAAVLLGCVRLVNDPAGLSRRWGLILGTLYGLALMSKFNLAALALLIETAVTVVAWRRGEWRRWLVANLFITLAALLVAGWWFLRNQLLYGEPTGFRILTELWGVRDAGSSFGLAVSELPYAWSTLWGRFGFGQIPLPQPIYDGLLWFAAFCLAGLMLPLLRRRPSLDVRALSPTAVSIGLLVLDVLIVFAVLFNYMLVSPAGAMGRFFFPGLPALTLLIFFGLSQWAALIRPGGRVLSLWKRTRLGERGLALAVTLAMLSLALVALFGYLAPAYARPPSWPAEAALPNPVNAQFDSLVTLRGYEVAPQAVQPGQPLDVTLYWEVDGRPPGDYWLFIHLVDTETGALIVQRDTHPGLGRFPSSQWQPGERFVEQVRLYLPETAYTPAVARLDVGLYAPRSYRLSVTGPDGASLGDALTLAEGIALQPWASGPETAVPNPLAQNFNDELRLLGYDYDARLLHPGQPLTVTLYWESLQEKPDDYVVEVRLVDEAGQGSGAADGRPAGGPTSGWQAGQRVVDPHTFTLPPDLSPGVYTVQVALANARNGRRQNIVAEDGHWINDYLSLSAVRVVE